MVMLLIVLRYATSPLHYTFRIIAWSSLGLFVDCDVKYCSALSDDKVTMYYKLFIFFPNFMSSRHDVPVLIIHFYCWPAVELRQVGDISTLQLKQFVTITFKPHKLCAIVMKITNRIRPNISWMASKDEKKR